MRQCFVIINTEDDDPVTDDDGRLHIYTDRVTAENNCEVGEHVELLDWTDMEEGILDPTAP